MVSSAGLLCLALNIFWEARSEDKEYGLLAMAAPARVVMNRVKSPEYPNNICDVVKQAKTWKGNPVKNQCQFSWFCDGKSDKPKDKKSWAWSQQIARLVLSGVLEDVTGGATHYHAHYVKPKWRTKKTFTIKIGSHLYYRKKKGK